MTNKKKPALPKVKELHYSFIDHYETLGILFQVCVLEITKVSSLYNSFYLFHCWKTFCCIGSPKMWLLDKLSIHRLGKIPTYQDNWAQSCTVSESKTGDIACSRRWFQIESIHCYLTHENRVLEKNWKILCFIYKSKKVYDFKFPLQQKKSKRIF